MRIFFDEMLRTLNVEMIKMGALCEDAITCAVKALLDNDAEMAESAFAAERAIDEKEREIESLCMKLLLQQQPVAADLRMVSSALKMISDMERIGDQAADIAEMTGFVGSEHTFGKVHIKEMALEAISMVTGSLQSFVDRDVAAAQAVIAADDKVDALFSKVRRELIALIAEQPEHGEACIDILMIAKYLERIGDHATNIAEWVEFSVTGSHHDTEALS
ncbi:MAG: phosphate signaling complex protein PhoU [Oscillospiraceae bacterium]|nr:phosphate signaling complex protein PhoU [Oscillospiraceae bacterium]